LWATSTFACHESEGNAIAAADLMKRDSVRVCGAMKRSRELEVLALLLKLSVPVSLAPLRDGKRVRMFVLVRS
jgi:hypothetical protein